MIPIPQAQPKPSYRKTALRLIGVILLIWLLSRLGWERVWEGVKDAQPIWVAAATLLLIPQMVLKTWRWQRILTAQGISYPFRLAFSAYLVSLLAGFLTPGRVGEFTKVYSVCKDCQVSPGLALSGVLTDRALDLGAMLLVGGLALLNLGEFSLLWLPGMVLALLLPMFLFFYEPTFRWMAQTGSRLGRFGHHLFAEQGWLFQMRLGLLQMTGDVLASVVGLTILAYGLYFLQAYWLAKAMQLPLDFIHSSYAMALGGLVSLLPISISGLGTREAVLVSYLGRLGVAAEQAVSLSLLVFSASYIFGSLLGAVAWWFHPISMRASIHMGRENRG